MCHRHIKYILCRAGGTHRNVYKLNKKKNTHKHSLPPGLCGDNLLTSWRCHQRGLSSQSLGKYWQLNQSNQHTSTYSRIQQHTNNPYYTTIHNEYAQENPRINRQDRQKVTFPGSAYPKEIPSSALPLHTQKQYPARGSSWGLPSLSLTTEGSWIHLGGRVAKPLVSPLTPVPPRYKIPEFFTIAPVLTANVTVCCRNRGDPSSLYRTCGALQVLQKKHSRFG